MENLVGKNNRQKTKAKRAAMKKVLSGRREQRRYWGKIMLKDQSQQKEQKE
jgi:hypothetical protein